MMKGLRAANVDVRLRGNQILQNVDFELSEPGHSYGLVGVNGAGKTTLLRSLAGALRPVRGQITVNGQALYSRNVRRRAALRKVALMPQHVNFPNALTAIELVSHLSWLRGMNRVDALTASRRALARVCLSEVSEVRLGKLSGGMLRRVALAQALAAHSQIILLDEPSAGLDPEQRRIMVDILGEIDDSIVLMSSHVMMDIQEVTQHTLVISDGSIIHQGTTRCLYKYDTSEKQTLTGGFLSLIGRRAER